VTGAISHAGLVDEFSAPQLSSDAPDDVSSVAGEPNRPEAPISRAAPAPPVRPVQRPPAVVRENRPRLAMVLPQPRAVIPRPPAAVPPPPATAVPIVPPVALLDAQTLEAALPEPSQPVQPPSGTTYRQPELIRRVEPVYSGFAKDARLQGSVQIAATIGTDGLPRSLQRVSGNSALAEMAMDAVRRWRYQPAQLNGQPVDAQTVITFNFQLR
jgi:protein TonB